LFVFGKTIQYEYNLDDKLATSIYPSVKKGLNGIPEILTSPFLGKNEPRYGGYRPLTRITFAIEYALFGENTSINHLINILIYCINCFLFHQLILFVFPKWEWWLIGIAALIFVCHPLHVEVVASLKNREVLLSFLFGILSILVLLKEVTLLKIVLSIALFLLAAFSKLDAVFFPVFLAFLFYVKERWKAWQAFSYGITLPVTAVVIYFLVQSQFPEPLILDIHYYENPIVGNEFSINHFATIAYIMAYNLRLMFFPNQFLFFYGTGPFALMSWGNIVVLLSAIFHFALLVLMVFGIYKKKKFSLIIIFYFFSIGLYLNLVQLIPGVVGDRFLFTTVGALGLIFGYTTNFFYSRYSKSQTIKIISICIGLLFCIYCTIQANERVKCWESPIQLGECDIDQLHNSLTAQEIYLKFLETELKKSSSSYDKNYLVTKSIEHGYKVLQIQPKNFNAKQHLGYVFCSELDSIQLGGRLLFEAMQLSPTNPQVLYNLGLCFEKKGELENATKFYKTALEYEEQSVTIKSKLAMSYCISGNLKEAKLEVDDLVKNYAFDYKSFICEGTFHLFQNDTLKATQSFEKALKLKPDLEGLKLQVANYYKSKGLFDKADKYISD